MSKNFTQVTLTCTIKLSLLHKNIDISLEVPSALTVWIGELIACDGVHWLGQNKRETKGWRHYLMAFSDLDKLPKIMVLQ